MFRRTIAIAVLTAAFAVPATVAHAAVPHWIWGNPVEEVPLGMPVEITTEGTLAFQVVEVSGKKFSLKCKVNDRETIENPASGGPGVDKMGAFVITNCTGKALCATGAPISFQAVGLPWATVLLAGPPIRDEIKGVAIQELCGTAVLTTFTGNLAPEIKGFGGLKFGPGSGTLEDPAKDKLTLKGTDKMKGPPPKTKIGAM